MNYPANVSNELFRIQFDCTTQQMIRSVSAENKEESKGRVKEDIKTAPTILINLTKYNNNFSPRICQTSNKLNNILQLYFLGAFSKLRKSTVSFLTSVCPSASNNSAATGRILMIFQYLSTFRNSVEKNSSFIKI